MTAEALNPLLSTDTSIAHASKAETTATKASVTVLDDHRRRPAKVLSNRHGVLTAIALQTVVTVLAVSIVYSLVSRF